MKVTPPAIPKGGGAIRGIGETFQSDEFTGSSSLSIPIPVSPCRGMQPILSLAYSSGNGNSPLGLGFGLSVPLISRKTSRGLPLYDESDTFLLSNAEDLVPLDASIAQSPPGDGNYLITSYRPRLEEGFATIEHWVEKNSNPLNSHWRTISHDGTVNLFGKTGQARIADTESPSHIFQWLLEETCDSLGNRIVYEYKAEDTANVPIVGSESTRSHTANRYLERIKYGNTLPGSAPNHDKDSQWMFEVVFDYGEYQLPPANPNPYQPQRDWPCRPDSYSSYHAGFEIRTHRLCRQVLMFHRFAKEFGADPVLVHATQLEYRETPSASFLSKVQSTGLRRDNGQYTLQSLPPLEFGYTAFAPDKQTFERLQDTGGKPLAGLEHHPDYLLVDLYGEGVPGILYSDGSTTYYREPQASGYAPQAVPAQLPIDSYGPGLTQRLLDLTGDGQLALLVSGGGRAGYYEAQPDRGWSPYQPFPDFPNDFHNPHNVLADLTGDGLADMVLMEREQVRLYPSLGKNGFAPPISQAQTHAPPLPVAPDAREVWQFADMLGAGTPQLVHIRNGLVECWPSLGYGRFGERVRLDNAPTFEPELDASRLFFTDLDGFGPADLIYAHSDRFEIYFNHSGNAFSRKPLVIGMPDGVRWDPLAQIRFADLKGNGTTCLILSLFHPTPQHWCYDFSAGHKPYLLNQIDNHLGALTKISYCSSTRYYLQDKQADLPWIVNLPFPVQVVEKIEHLDQISGTHLTSTYAYHHGYYDGEEREFRGFGLVERQDAENLEIDAKPTDVPPVLSKTWYHTGTWRRQASLSKQYRAEYFQGDPAAHDLPDSVLDAPSPDDEARREACRSLKGQVLRREVYGLDGSALQNQPYSVSETNYRIQQLQPKGQNRYGVYFVHERETINYDYERQATDPSTRHEFVLALDEWGNVLRSADVAYGRRNNPGKSVLDEQRSLKITAAQNRYINQTGPDSLLLGIPLESHAYEILKLQPAGGYFDFAELDRATAVLGDNAKLLDWQRHHYWNPQTRQAFEFGTCGPQALPMYSEDAAFAPGEVEQAFADVLPADDMTKLLRQGGYRQEVKSQFWWNPGTQTHYLDADQFFLPAISLDPFGNKTQFEYDAYHLLAVKATDALGNTTSVAAIDYHTLQAQKIQDPNGNISEALYDPLGQVVVTSHYEQAEGFDPLSQYNRVDNPTLDDIIKQPENYLQQAAGFFYYNLSAWDDNRQPVHAVSLAAENYPGTAAPVHIAIAYNDGFGRALQSTANVEPGPAYVIIDDKPVEQDSLTRWLTTGRVVYNNKGQPVEQYEPYYSAAYQYIDNPVLNRFGVSSTLWYDALGRLVRTDEPKGFFSKVEFDAWTERHYDENDTLLDAPYYQANISRPDPQSPYYNPAITGAEKLALAKAALFYDTPEVKVLDNLGRVVRDSQTLVTLKNQPKPEIDTQATLTTAYVWDIQGQQIASSDPRLFPIGKQNFQTSYALGGMALKTVSADAGTRWALLDAVGNPLYSRDSRGFVHTTAYDALLRPISFRVQGGDGQKPLDNVVEILIYGDSLDDKGQPFFPDAAQKNLKGRLVRHYDPAGRVEISAYNQLGLPLASTRQLRRDYQTEADWRDMSDAALKNILAPETYTFSYQYDALGRVTSETNPGGNIQCPVYHLSGRLQQVTLDGKAYVQNIDYNAKNQRLKVAYGNGVATKHQYEATTFRLTNIDSQRAAQPKTLQALAYTYDPAGNVAQMTDNAQQIVYNANQPVAPDSIYSYDSLYRLTAASGREHPQSNGEDGQFPAPQPLGNDQALQNYARAFSYDAGGSLCQIQHQGKYPFTRKLTLAPDSNRAVDSQFTTDPQAVNNYFDPNGNQTQLAGVRSIAWNHRDQLASAVLIKRGEDQLDDAEYYVYDSAGQRVRKIALAYGNGGAVEHSEETLYLGGYEIKRIGQNGKTTEERRSVRLSDGQSAVATQITWTVGLAPDGSKTQTRYQLEDHLNSSMLELDNTGQIITYELYYPYGGTALSAGNKAEVKLKQYRYSGKERDGATGLYYYGARYYAPWLGRWMSPDPAGTVDGLNLYGFVEGEPVSHMDIGGLVRRKPKSSASTIDEKSKNVTKKERILRAVKIRRKIIKKYKNFLLPSRKIHRAQLYVGKKQEKLVPVNRNMSDERLLVRHISTAILAQNAGMVEVQAAISHGDKKIYVASNKKQGKLPRNIKLKDLPVPHEANLSGRVKRHVKKLAAEKAGKYKDYKIEAIIGLEDQHAETKIVERGVSFDYVGGTRRPCLACTFLFQLKNVDRKKFNQHPGAYWNTNAALLSLHSVWDQIYLTLYEGVLFRNKNVKRREMHDIDTDSDTDD